MDKEARLKRAVGIAAAFVGWLLVTVFIMIGLYQLMANVLQWNPYAAGTFSFISWLIMLIAPPVMITSYMDDTD